MVCSSLRLAAASSTDAAVAKSHAGRHPDDAES